MPAAEAVSLGLLVPSSSALWALRVPAGHRAKKWRATMWPAKCREGSTVWLEPNVHTQEEASTERVVVPGRESTNAREAEALRLLATRRRAIADGRQVGPDRVARRTPGQRRVGIEQVRDTAAQRQHLVDVPVERQVEDVVAVGLDLGRRRVAEDL